MTALMGSDKTRSSPVVSKLAASFRLATFRTSQVPLSPRVRTRFQPRPEGAIKTGACTGSILKFLPTKYLRRSGFPDNHLDRALHIAGSPQTNDPHYLVVNADQA